MTPKQPPEDQLTTAGRTASAQASTKRPVSEQFRRQLRTEVAQWHTEGLISPELQQQLAQRYGFSGLEQEASRQFLNVLLGLGGILLGLGAITFVAANWQGISPMMKTLVLLSSLVVTNVLGFSLWNDRRSLSRQRWGHCFLLLGMLLLGANLGLLPQIFHQSGPTYVLFLVWGLCIILMATALRLASLGIASLILLMVGYVTHGLTNFWDIWLPETFWEGIVALMPLMIVGWFIPLARWCRSRWLFALTAVALGLTMALNATYYTDTMPDWLVLALVLFLPAALLWSYDPQAWKLTSPSIALRSQAGQTDDQKQVNQTQISRKHINRKQARSIRRDRFRPIARGLALTSLTFSLYIISFRGLWNNGWAGGSFSTEPSAWLWLLDDFGLVILAKLGWLHILRQSIRSGQFLQSFHLRALNSGFVSLLITVPVMLILWTGLVGPRPILATVVVNGLLALLAIGLIRDGLALGIRSCFWLGMVLLVLDILTRTFEYNAGLTTKALVFTVCGLATLAAGVWFERKSRKQLLHRQLAHE